MCAVELITSIYFSVKARRVGDTLWTACLEVAMGAWHPLLRACFQRRHDWTPPSPSLQSGTHPVSGFSTVTTCTGHVLRPVFPMLFREISKEVSLRRRCSYVAPRSLLEKNNVEFVPSATESETSPPHTEARRVIIFIGN